MQYNHILKRLSQILKVLVDIVIKKYNAVANKEGSC